MDINKDRKILFLEACNYVNAPLGGQLTMARMLMRAFGPRLSLVGWTNDPDAPIGRWHKRIFDGVEYDFFATDYVPTPIPKPPLVPARAKNWFRFAKYGNEILSCDVRNILTREASIVMALPFKPKHNVCFWFPGVYSPLSASRYRWAKPFAPLFDAVLNQKLRKYVGTILAAADAEAIADLRHRAGGVLDDSDILFFPTRVDTTLFKPGDKNDARKRLSLPSGSMLVLTSGRLQNIKGWPLLLNAFKLFRANRDKAKLVFVGDGVDRPSIERAITNQGLGTCVTLAGHQPPTQLALYLQAADLFVMGSKKEGWSTSLVEALATGLPIVTTQFSGATTIVKDGINGFVVSRDANIFAKAMENAVKLEGISNYSVRESEKYSLSNLASELEKIWLVKKDAYYKNEFDSSENKISIKPRILLLEACNFVNAPLGGQLTAVRMLMRAFGKRLALVGWTDDPAAPIGKWHKRVIDSIEYEFFAIKFVPMANPTRPLIPARLSSFLRFRRYRKSILSCGIRNILTQEATIMMALSFTANHNVCFWFPGLASPLSVSRYKWAIIFSPIFDMITNRRLRLYAKTILAAADDNSIADYRRKAQGVLNHLDIFSFPSRVDTMLFHPGDQLASRKILSLPIDDLVLVTSGRLHSDKGWLLLLEAFQVFLASHPKAWLIFVGDGNERLAFKKNVLKKGLREHVVLTGYQPQNTLAIYLQAADLFVMGSKKEGWSTSLVEALACGLPIVTTRFSSADKIVKDGVNGFIVPREPIVFAKAMEDALGLSGVASYSAREVKNYLLTNLESDMEEVWPIL